MTFVLSFRESKIPKPVQKFRNPINTYKSIFLPLRVPLNHFVRVKSVFGGFVH